MARLQPLPHPSAVLIDPKSGRMTEEWYRYFASREKIGIANLSDVSTTAPADTEALIYNDTTKKWTPGAN